MATTVEICNRALRRVKATEISALTDDNREAQACNRHYDEVRRAALADGIWTFALKRQKLARDAAAPVFGYDNSFSLPADCIRLWKLYVDDQGVSLLRDYSTEARAVHANYQDLWALYIRDEDDPNVMSSHFREAMVSRLASELALTLANSRSLHEAMLDRYERTDLPRALSVSAIQNAGQEYPESSWVTARYGSDGGWGWGR
jgi:hypothetical protein